MAELELASRSSARLLVRASSLLVSVGNRVILGETDLEVGAGEVVAVLGPSGSGKTTLLACLGGLRKPSSGSIAILDHDLTAMSTRRRARLRLTSIGFVYQHADLLPELTPVQNVMLPALLSGLGADEAHSRASSLISDLGVDTSAATAEVSGGEAQRLALARALITGPSILLADEPTGGLDSSTRDAVLDLMVGKVRQRSMAAVVVTHDEAVAAVADRTVTVGVNPVRP